ncbi:gliding motility protein [Streptomyces sp. NPDC058623]|uniref:gliding motility protein n=1 Tax=Streptomyces sp. NPDC058623 TaxID=3346563 RepID=UPI003665D5F7
MGVFSRFFGRKDEVTTETVAAEADPAGTPVVETGPAAPAEEAETAVGTPAAEAVEIPKQQSAEAAADSEAGEGART